MKEKLIKKSVRLRPEQITYLQQQISEGVVADMSKYIRSIIDADRKNHMVSESSKNQLLRRELINEINHIGVNINQIVKNHNAQFYSAAEKRKLFLMMKKLNAVVFQNLKE